MILEGVARLAAKATNLYELDKAIEDARRVASPDQLVGLKAIYQEKKFRLAVTRREGTSDLEGRVEEALRVVGALYSLKAGAARRPSRTIQSIKLHGYVEALRRIIAKKDSQGLRTLADNDRLDCAFEQIALDFPDHFREGNTLAIAAETLKREREK